MSKNYPSIPDPLPNMNSLYDVVLALKQSVELLTGQRRDLPSPAHIFVSASTPSPERPGDLWVHTDGGNKLYYWTGKVWLPVTTA